MPVTLTGGRAGDEGLATGDRKGNLRFRLSARNFNPMAGMAGRHTIAEVEDLVEVDELHPDDVHLPGVFVDDVVPAAAARRPLTEGPAS